LRRGGEAVPPAEDYFIRLSCIWATERGLGCGIQPRTRIRGERVSVRIRHAVPRDFPLDLLVRTPADVKKRLDWGDPFLGEVMRNGRVMYEAGDV